ncbi:hypothetical protein [Streptomyces mirabilis]|uniref:hypothetical protein n=1 Tax=Streptomyces mirabilis TaxID=68239 RepID=UPI0033218C25
MSDDLELITDARATLAHIDEVADRARKAVVDLVRARTGREINVRPPSVMDATREQLIDAGRRARHAHEAMRLIFRFTWSAEYATLGALMRELPEDVREQIADHLWKAGLS